MRYLFKNFQIGIFRKFYFLIDTISFVSIDFYDLYELKACNQISKSFNVTRSF